MSWSGTCEDGEEDEEAEEDEAPTLQILADEVMDRLRAEDSADVLHLGNCLMSEFMMN